MTSEDSSGPGVTLALVDPFKLGGDGEAGCGVLPHVEAQQGEGYCNAAVHATSPLFYSVLDTFTLFSYEEEEEGEKREKIEGSP